MPCIINWERGNLCWYWLDSSWNYKIRGFLFQGLDQRELGRGGREEENSLDEKAHVQLSGFYSLYSCDWLHTHPPADRQKDDINGRSREGRCNMYYTSMSVCVCVYVFQRLVSLGVIQMTKKASELVKCSQTSLTNKTGLYNWAGMWWLKVL